MKSTNSQLFGANELPFAPSPNPASPADPMHHQLGNPPSVPKGSFPSWWIHLWAGLVRDPTAKHYKMMGNAVWLYLFLLISANRSDGTVLRKLETITAQTGLNERSVARWLQELRENRYITSTSNGRSLRIVITKWRPIKGGRSPTK